MGYPNTQPRTDAHRQQDRKRKDKQTRKRKPQTGNPGRASKRTLEMRKYTFDKLKNEELNLFDNIPTPGELSGVHKRILEVLLKDHQSCLTNKQIAELVGCHANVVGRFRESGTMYSLLANAEIFDRVLQRLESKSLIALENNIQLGDNQSIKMVMQMRGRLNEARTQVLILADSEVKASVTESLRGLLPNKQADNAIEADYSVEDDRDTVGGDLENEDTR